MTDLEINPDSPILGRLFPFFILIDRDFRITGTGDSLRKVISTDTGDLFSDHFAFVRPKLEQPLFSNLHDLAGQLIILGAPARPGITFRGQFEVTGSGDRAVFLGSPWFNSVDQLPGYDLNPDDFARHDPTIDLLNLLKSADLTKQEILSQLDMVNKQMEELTRSKLIAEVSARTKESFMAAMSHEIRTPMNAILGLTRELKKTTMDGTQKRYLNAINSAADTLFVIINDILDFSRIESGKLTLGETGFSLNRLVRKAVMVIRHKAESKGLTFQYFIDPDLPPVLIGDPYRINQLLMSLLGNSVKFTENGNIRLECTLADTHNGEPILGIKVSDTGIGMEKSFLNSLFDKFTQEESSIAGNPDGTGLGMSITSLLVRLMNGKISVESTKNVGTSFFIEIPLRTGTMEDLPKTEKAVFPPTLLKQKKILLVEDNLFNRMVAAVILKRYGADLQETDNGKKAINLLKQESFDLVLMDIQMPVMDGYEATLQVRNSLQLDIPIIALTANALMGEKEKCLGAGMNDYMAKPFEETSLVRICARWLNCAVPASENVLKKKEELRLYDLTMIRDVAGGKADLFNEIINAFIEQTNKVIPELDQAADASDYLRVSRIVHSIKPSIEMFGIGSITDQVRTIEKLARESNPSGGIPSMLKNVESVLREVAARLESEIIREP